MVLLSNQRRAVSSQSPGTKEDEPTLAIRPAGHAAVPAVLRDPAARRLQRQHLQAVADPRHPLQARHLWRQEHLHQPLRAAVHPAVLPVLGPGWTVRREVRQGRADPRDQAGRSGDHGGGGAGFLLRQPAVAVPGTVRHGHPLGAVRPGEIFDPAAGAARRRTGGRQRPGGDGHLPGHPRRHHQRRRHDVRRTLRAGGGLRHRPHRQPGLPRQPRHSPGGGGAAGTETGLEHLPPVLADHAPGAGPAAVGVALAGG